MSDADKKKLTIAVALLVVAGGFIAWYLFGSGGGVKGDDLPVEAAPVVQTKDGPPPAANRRIPAPPK
ncbi:MAG: hypothetical protein WCK33_03970 [Phycisphaerae bacterium]|jgi:hypothetical protein